MSSGAFLFVFSAGAAALALWICVCVPKLGPSSMYSAFAHVAAAIVVAALLRPALAAIATSDFPLAVFLGVFVIALPALTYMFVAGAWLIRALSGGLSR